MCGIWLTCGIRNLSWANSFSRISHRGPDAWRIELESRINNVIMGFHRLSIVGPLYGMQPMRVHKFPHLFLLCNGEIFNHQRLAAEHKLDVETDCDVEVILHLYDKYGIDGVVKNLDGEFALAIVDIKTNQLHIARDPYGVRPSFVLRTDCGVLGYCSEAKGLVSLLPAIKSESAKVVQFPPGTWETYNIDPVTGLTSLHKAERYYTIGTSKPTFSTAISSSDLEKKTVLDNIRELFIESVSKRLMSNRRIGCLLSGGLDSSLVASLLVKLAKEKNFNYNIQTYSVGMENSPDLVAARKVADYLGTEHHEVIFTEQDVFDVLDRVLETLETADITTVRASIGMYILSQYIRKIGDSVVILSGEGADEIAQGYIYFRDAPDANIAHEESLRLLRDVHLYDGLRADRTTAAFSLELRLPFLDVQFSSYYLSLSPESRQPQNGVEKHLLRSAFAGTGLLPDSILWRNKEAFSDGVASLKKSLFQIIQEEIDRRLGVIDLENELKKFEHCPPKTKESLYYRKFFDATYQGQIKHLMPYFWMPKWTDVSDPSARFIKHYNAATE